MGYDINFWKQKPGCKLSPQDVYERLSNGDEVEGLETLPIESVLARLKEAFSSWEQLDAQTWEGPSGSFQVYTTPQFFRIDCYGLSDEEMNVFIDIGSEFGCPLYDPQTGKRFDGA